MVDYIISYLRIGPESTILDLGCGRGMYTIRIAKLTGCKYVGVDLNAGYAEECKKRAEEHGVQDQGTFYAASIMDMGEEIVGQRYTHVLILGVMLFCHGNLDAFLQGSLRACCNDDTKVYIWDHARKVNWDLCVNTQRHLKLPHPIMTSEEVRAAIDRARFKLTKFEDDTKYVIPGYLILTRE